MTKMFKPFSGIIRKQKPEVKKSIDIFKNTLFTIIKEGNQSLDNQDILEIDLYLFKYFLLRYYKTSFDILYKDMHEETILKSFEYDDLIKIKVIYCRRVGTSNIAIHNYCHLVIELYFAKQVITIETDRLKSAVNFLLFLQANQVEIIDDYNILQVSRDSTQDIYIYLESLDKL